MKEQWWGSRKKRSFMSWSYFIFWLYVCQDIYLIISLEMSFKIRIQGQLTYIPSPSISRAPDPDSVYVSRIQEKFFIKLDWLILVWFGWPFQADLRHLAFDWRSSKLMKRRQSVTFLNSQTVKRRRDWRSDESHDGVDEFRGPNLSYLSIPNQMVPQFLDPPTLTSHTSLNPPYM